MKKTKTVGFKGLKVKALIALGTSLVMLSGCGANQGGYAKTIGLLEAEEPYKVTSETLIDVDETAKKSIEASNKMGLELVQEMVRSNKDKNMLFSPISLSFALAMVDNGAEGETKSEILKAMGEDEEGINERYNLLMNYLNALDTDESSEMPGIRMKVANSLWIANRIEPKKEFVNTLNAFYNAQVYHSDFGDEKTVDEMNQWVEEQTNHMLKETIGSVDPQTIACLMNTVYFKGTWRDEFQESNTYEEAFYKTETEKNMVDMMHQTDSKSYYEDELCQAIRLPYYGGNSMVIVLPKGDLDSLVSELDYDDFNKIIAQDQSEMQNLEISLPKFDYKVNNPLKELLANRGMEKAFSQEEAEFTKMVELANENLYINSIFQNARIKVDEKGTEAAAVTAITFETAAAEMPNETITFKCDKPFLYIIKDDATDMALFLGVVREP